MNTFSLTGRRDSQSAINRQMANQSSFHLEDNRSASYTQKKQVEAMGGSTPVQRKLNNTGLPDQLKSGIEGLSGHSMDDVKVHYNSAKPAQLNAHAYAQGSDIHIASGKEKHLAHEAWHVVQQKQGRVQPTMQMKGKVSINDNAGLEKEADVMGARALQMKSHTNYKPAGPISNKNLNTRNATGLLAKKIAQRVKFVNVKRVANHSSLYMGINFAGPPALGHNGGTNWWGPKVTANAYAGLAGTMWRSTANNALNLVDMSSAKQVQKAMRESVRQRGIAGLSPALLAVLVTHEFAYAIPNAVANAAEMALQYGLAESVALGTGAWTANPYVTQAAMNTAVNLATVIMGMPAGDPQIPVVLGATIQVFADHNSLNSVQLDSPLFLANPNGFRVIRKDNTPGDLAFANALIQDLDNARNMFHGLHVPAGMKFGGWTPTKHELLIRNCPANLTLQPGPVVIGGPEPELAVSNKTLGVDDSKLARAWRFFGGNR